MFIFLIGWFDTRRDETIRELYKVYIPHWLIRYMRAISPFANTPCLYSSLVDSIRKKSHSLNALVLFIFLIGWFDTKMLIFHRYIVQFIFLVGWFDTEWWDDVWPLLTGLYSSLVDSIRENRISQGSCR